MLEGLILLGTALWAFTALRYTRKHKGSCGGDCAHCQSKHCHSSEQ